MGQAQDTIVNSSAVAFKTIETHFARKGITWDNNDNESTNEDDLLRSDAQTSNVEEEMEKEYKHTTNDNINYEIQAIEDEVESIENNNYPEETESEDPMEIKLREILQQMETNINEKNEIVR